MNWKAHIFDKKSNAQILYQDLHAAEILSERLLSSIPSGENRQIVFVCIGTDRSTGDSLGPLVGTLLEEKKLSHFFVYGTLDEPIHAVNMETRLKEIAAKHPNPFIVAIDACLGRLKNIGVIQIGDGPVKPGAGVNKELPAIGDIHITGIVNVSGFMEFFVLQNTRLNLVMKMAKTIATGISRASLLYPKQSWNEINWEQKNELSNR